MSSDLCGGKGTGQSGSVRSCLLFSLLFPMSSCDSGGWQRLSQNLKNGPEAQQSETSAPVSVSREYHYVVRADQLGERSTYIGLSFFLWPSIAAWIAARPRRRVLRIIVLIGEFLLSGVTAYVLVLAHWLLSDPELGVYIALTGLACFVIGWFFNLLFEWRDWRREHIAAAPG